MLTIAVCVGSSCHLKGSYDIIQQLQSFIIKQQLHDHIELKGVFCLGYCTQGVAIKVNDEIITTVNNDNIQELFEHEILPRLEVL